MSKANLTITVGNGVQISVDLSQQALEGADALKLECIQQLITTLLSGGSWVMAILAFARCSFGFSEEERAELQALAGTASSTPTQPE